MKNETKNETSGAFIGFLLAPWELYRTALKIEHEGLRLWFTAGWILAALTAVGLLIATIFV